MQIGPAVSQTIGNFRELHGNYRSTVSALMETADRQLIDSFRNDRPFPNIR